MQSTEFGDSTDIEKSLTIAQNDEQIEDFLTLGNGCICCSVKDAGVNAIESLMARHAATTGTSKPFDYIILETSGLADPGNLVPLFWVDEGLGSSLYLDGVVCLVDTKNLLLSLDERRLGEQSEGHTGEENGGKHETVAHLQISGADVVVINKCETVTSEQLEKVEQRIRSINGLAKVHKTSYSKVPQLESYILDLHAYDGVEALDVEKRPHNHLDPVSMGSYFPSLCIELMRLQTISTVSLPLPILAPSQLDKLEIWLRSILWDSVLPTPGLSSLKDSDMLGGDGPDPKEFGRLNFLIHRTKGRVIIADGTVKMVQGVREVFEMEDLEERRDGGQFGNAYSDVKGKLVLIGKGLNEELFRRSLEGSLGI